MMRQLSRRPPWPALVVFGLLGLALAAQLNLQRELKGAPRFDEARLEQVLSLYMDQKAEAERLQRKLEELRAEVASERRLWADQRVEEVQRELELVRRFAGLTALAGPGLRLQLRDAQFAGDAGFDQSAYTVHDQDLLLVINELWAAGAEAISVNGQRMVVDSEVRCSGPVINVNGRSIAPPYEICAIGDAETLRAALEDLRGGIVDQLRNAGIEVRSFKEKNIIVPPLGRDPQFRYARPTVLEPAARTAGE